MLEELNKYRDEFGYVNLELISNCKDIAMREYYTNLIKQFKDIKYCILKDGRIKIRNSINTYNSGMFISIDTLNYYSKYSLNFRPYNPIMESIAAAASNYIGGNYIPYDVVEIDGLPFSSLSRSFLKNGSYFHTLDELIDSVAFKDLSLKRLVELLDKRNIDNDNKICILKHTLETSIIDRFFSQFDRHCANYGYLVNNGRYDVVPNFDCEYWFPEGITTKDIRKYSDTKYTRRFMMYYMTLKENKRAYGNCLCDYSVYDIVTAILIEKVDYLTEIPDIIKELLENFDKTILENMINFNPNVFINMLPYKETKQNEIYTFLLQKSKENFFKQIEKSESRIKRL